VSKTVPKNARIQLRPRRQITLPAWAAETLGVKEGDYLSVSETDRGLLVQPGEQAALEALRAIQQAFAASGITEEELQEEGRRVREELVRELYGD
jgi:AbrB family looped-hinge helix DNA binding protein